MIELDALSQSCEELANPRTRVKLCALLTEKLSQTISQMSWLRVDDIEPCEAIYEGYE
ncbi:MULTISPECIES: hypothetical protein [Pseudomonas fluorescens group]